MKAATQLFERGPALTTGSGAWCRATGLLRESQGQPLLVVFEDLHWIDSETQALLDGLVESLPAARAAAADELPAGVSAPLGQRTYYTQLRLDPLPPETAEELLGALLGSDAGLEPLTRVLPRVTITGP